MTDNELIAEFMGFTCADTGQDRFWNPPDMPFATIYDWKYHTNHLDDFQTSWDWLMPAVKKISEIHGSKFNYDVNEIKQGKWPEDNEYMEVIALPLATPIIEAHKAVVQFIKFYNSQK